MRVYFINKNETHHLPGPNSKHRRTGAAEVLKATGLVCSAKNWDELQQLELDFFEALKAGIREFSGCFDTALITLTELKKEGKK